MTPSYQIIWPYSAVIKHMEKLFLIVYNLFVFINLKCTHTQGKNFIKRTFFPFTMCTISRLTSCKCACMCYVCIFLPVTRLRFWINFSVPLDSGLYKRGKTQGGFPKWQLHSIKVLLEVKGNGEVAICREKSTFRSMEGGLKLCNHGRPLTYSNIIWGHDYGKKENVEVYHWDANGRGIYNFSGFKRFNWRFHWCWVGTQSCYLQLTEIMKMQIHSKQQMFFKTLNLL